MKALYHIVGPAKDVMAPDVHTDAALMGDMMGTYSEMEGMYTPGSITGKPPVIGGSKGRQEGTARGCVYIIQQILESIEREEKDVSIAIQGFGSAASPQRASI
ncbi:glutamate dehydrogenase/leucine dehydrogenase [Geomicrobium halophilum]|uniref:Glutamate dehydrogenase/leucine dehydrogenase n=1 Tax=Geomicrobium halophilum TaxID=549000 RepID=A0A841PLN4_9BACL|nr:hypothetical protein [Geomicrobium halophilum]MBB6448126.1 glutamate dehydrogenase/leucine dehydrogenase [Geomicrobium halophilum]